MARHSPYPPAWAMSLSGVGQAYQLGAGTLRFARPATRRSFWGGGVDGHGVVRDSGGCGGAGPGTYDVVVVWGVVSRVRWDSEF